MTQFYSRVDVNYSGDVYSIPFNYIDKKEIKVYIDDELWTKWHFIQQNQLTLDEVPENIDYASIISVRRETNIDEKVVSYNNNSLLNMENLNKSQDQLLYAVQEIYDNNIQFQIDTDEVIKTNKQEVLEIQDDFKQEVYKIVDEVKDAANKVNELEEAVNTAITAANTATEQAEITINKATETTEIVEQANINIQGTIQDFTKNIDSKISTNDKNMQNVLAETEAVLQEAKDTLDDTLNKSQITNCITEIPQRIKLELNNGVLTLKAGSEVIVPNGFEVDGVTPRFDYLITQVDLNISAVYNDRRTLFITQDLKHIDAFPTNVCYSGTSAPSGTQYMYWYDTQNNKITRTANSGSTWEGVWSLPIGIFSGTDVITTLHQVFNGFGYIGSHMWVDKGVKVSIPNGRNTDNSLNNIELTTNRVSIQTRTGNTGNNGVIFLDKNGNLYITANNNPFYEQEKQPNVAIANWARWFNTKENLQYAKAANENFVVATPYAVVGKITSTSGVLSDLQIKQPFRAVDYSDAVVKTDLSECHVVVETYKNGTSWYRVYSDGWCEQGGFLVGASVTVTLLKPYKDTNYQIYCQWNGGKSQNFYPSDQSISNITVNGFTTNGNGHSNVRQRNWMTKGYIQ